VFTLDLVASSPGEILCFSIREIRDIQWSSAIFHFFADFAARNPEKLLKQELTS